MAADWRLIPTTRRTSRDCVDIVSSTDGTIAVYVARHWAEQIVADHNRAARCACTEHTELDQDDA